MPHFLFTWYGAYDWLETVEMYGNIFLWWLLHILLVNLYLKWLWCNQNLLWLETGSSKHKVKNLHWTLHKLIIEVMLCWCNQPLLIILNMQPHLWSTVVVVSWLGLAWFLEQAHDGSSRINFTDTYCLLVDGEMHLTNAINLLIGGSKNYRKCTATTIKNFTGGKNGKFYSISKS